MDRWHIQFSIMENILRRHLEVTYSRPVSKGRISYGSAIPDIFLHPAPKDQHWRLLTFLVCRKCPDSSLNLLCSNSFFILITVGNPQAISKEYFKALHQMQEFGKCEWVKV